MEHILDKISILMPNLIISDIKFDINLDIGNEVDINDIKIGDHIYVKRNIYIEKYNLNLPYTHHGIVVNINPIQIIHPTDKDNYLNKVFIKSEIETFLNTSTDIYIVDYKNKLDITSIINLAYEYLDKEKNKEYNIIDNNCEIFANYCCTGKYQSTLIEKYMECTKKYIPKEYHLFIDNKELLKNMVQFIKLTNKS